MRWKRNQATRKGDAEKNYKKKGGGCFVRVLPAYLSPTRLLFAVLTWSTCMMTDTACVARVSTWFANQLVLVYTRIP